MKLLKTALVNALTTRSVRNKENYELGCVTEITFDGNKEAQYVILAANHFSGKEERYFAIPVSLAFMEIDNRGKVVFNLEDDDLIFAKRVRFDECPTIKENNFFPSLYEVYGYEAPQRHSRKKAI